MREIKYFQQISLYTYRSQYAGVWLAVQRIIYAKITLPFFSDLIRFWVNKLLKCPKKVFGFSSHLTPLILLHAFIAQSQELIWLETWVSRYSSAWLCVIAASLGIVNEHTAKCKHTCVGPPTQLQEEDRHVIHPHVQNRPWAPLFWLARRRCFSDTISRL